jgi:hypothetical protein|tara:strand:+ start:4701 stop:4973 length:273 start_codon:yes stop_codon:yes gene_type:complete
MATKTKISKSEKVISALKGGAELTAKQIASRYGVKNVRALISSLRMQGYPVYLNKRTSLFGGEKTVYNKYSLGTASRAVIAAGYKALRTA